MAPVFGAPPVAEAAQLIVVMAGDYRSKKEVAHLMVPAMGRKVIDLGGNLEKGPLKASKNVATMVLILGAAPTFKLIGNSLILGSLEILAEGFTLAEKSGIQPTQVHSLVKDLMPAPMYALLCFYVFKPDLSADWTLTPIRWCTTFSMERKALQSTVVSKILPISESLPLR